MKSSEQINKIKAVVLYILQSFKEGTDYIKLFKLMYFAQRGYIAKYGRPIFENSFPKKNSMVICSLNRIFAAEF